MVSIWAINLGLPAPKENEPARPPCPPRRGGPRRPDVPASCVRNSSHVAAFARSLAPELRQSACIGLREEYSIDTMRLTDQQSLRIADLPENYRVVGVDRSAPFVRKPKGAAHAHPAEWPPDRGHGRDKAQAHRSPGQSGGRIGRSMATIPYTRIMD